jgi:hypothetical protein
MNTTRTCQVCFSSVTSEECTHCPACGAKLDADHPVTDSTSVHDILKNVKQQIDALDGIAEEQPDEDGSDHERDVSVILSNLDFQALLNENLSDGDSAESGESSELPPDDASAEGMQTAIDSVTARTDLSADHPDGSDTTADPEQPSAIGKALGSYKQTHVPAAEQAAAPVPAHSSAESRDSEPALSRYESADSDMYVPVRPDAHDPPAGNKPRTWRGGARQTIWLVLLLLLSIALFRIFGPDKKEPTIDDFFQPGNPEVRFLDAVNFLEEYYERQRTEQTRAEAMQPADAPDEGMQPYQPNDEMEGSSALMEP